MKIKFKPINEYGYMFFVVYDKDRFGVEESRDWEVDNNTGRFIYNGNMYKYNNTVFESSLEAWKIVDEFNKVLHDPVVLHCTKCASEISVEPQELEDHFGSNILTAYDNIVYHFACPVCGKVIPVDQSWFRSRKKALDTIDMLKQDSKQDSEN